MKKYSVVAQGFEQQPFWQVMLSKLSWVSKKQLVFLLLLHVFLSLSFFLYISSAVIGREEKSVQQFEQNYKHTHSPKSDNKPNIYSTVRTWPLIEDVISNVSSTSFSIESSLIFAFVVSKIVKPKAKPCLAH